MKPTVGLKPVLVTALPGAVSMTAAQDVARVVRLQHALDSVAIPLHPGAERYHGQPGLSDG